MCRQRFEARIDARDLGRAESLLELAGAESITLADAESTALLEPDPGTTPIWPKLRIRAIFAASIDLKRLERLIRASAPSVDEVEIGSIRREDWESAGKECVAALRFGRRLRLVPASAASPDAGPLGGVADESAQRNGKLVDVRLNMGLAFGTGHHPTTALCLEWLEAHAGQSGTVVDYGCGSGVLAIAALCLGAHRAYASDNDPQALDAARRNARLNGVEHRAWIGPPRELPDVRADVVVANILAGTLESLAGQLTRLVAPGGHVVLSGLLEEQLESVRRAYASCGFERFEISIKDGWTRLSAQRAGG